MRIEIDYFIENGGKTRLHAWLRNTISFYKEKESALKIRLKLLLFSDIISYIKLVLQFS